MLQEGAAGDRLPGRAGTPEGPGLRGHRSPTTASSQGLGSLRNKTAGQRWCPCFITSLRVNLNQTRHTSVGIRSCVAQGIAGRLTFGVLRGFLPLCHALQADGDAQKLHVAIAVPHQQLLLREDFLAALVEDLSLALDSRQILLLGEPGTVYQGHPVASRSLPVYKVAQATAFKDLESREKSIRFDRPFRTRPALTSPTTHTGPSPSCRWEGTPKASPRPRAGGAGWARRCLLYLPHQRVVVVSLDLARVDHFASERAEADSFRDGVGTEDSELGHVPVGHPEHREPWGWQGAERGAARAGAARAGRALPSGSCSESRSSSGAAESAAPAEEEPLLQHGTGPAGAGSASSTKAAAQTTARLFPGVGS